MIKLQAWNKINLPNLSSDEKQRLKSSIDKFGLKNLLLALPDGRIIDGKHRWEILAGKVPEDKLEILDVSDEEAEALAYSLNLDRRHLSPEQIKEIRETLLNQTIPKLRKQGMTQKKASQITGIPQQTISDHEKRAQSSNTEVGKARLVPDMRAKIDKPIKEHVIKRVASGETQKQVADDLKLSKQRVSQIVKKDEQQKREKAEGTRIEKVHRQAINEDLDKFKDAEKLYADLLVIQGVLEKYISAANAQFCSVLAFAISKIEIPNDLLIETWSTYKHAKEVNG
jgi:transcriptional regulator